MKNRTFGVEIDRRGFEFGVSTKSGLHFAIANTLKIPTDIPIMIYCKTKASFMFIDIRVFFERKPKVEMVMRERSQTHTRIHHIGLVHQQQIVVPFNNFCVRSKENAVWKSETQLGLCAFDVLTVLIRLPCIDLCLKCGVMMWRQWHFTILCRHFHKKSIL